MIKHFSRRVVGKANLQIGDILYTGQDSIGCRVVRIDLNRLRLITRGFQRLDLFLFRSLNFEYKPIAILNIRLVHFHKQGLTKPCKGVFRWSSRGKAHRQDRAGFGHVGHILPPRKPFPTGKGASAARALGNTLPYRADLPSPAADTAPRRARRFDRQSTARCGPENSESRHTFPAGVDFRSDCLPSVVHVSKDLRTHLERQVDPFLRWGKPAEPS